MIEHDFRYAIDIVEKEAYIMPIKDLSHYHALVRDSDFVGDKTSCEEFIRDNKITKVYGDFVYEDKERE